MQQFGELALPIWQHLSACQLADDSRNQLIYGSKRTQQPRGFQRHRRAASILVTLRRSSHRLVLYYVVGSTPTTRTRSRAARGEGELRP
ncbi:hypothetical protein BB31_29445 [Amycolatopsis lurida NRRL 2430]|uniref:Uncharacterized protein n=1 Tax=Amycolatopsis lurida NRRL 2430 TaxID=1460371 RepID=A0A2P2FM37_AMYLU|nr:hypothetical protein BB31_29445 [Amycolatopsis lurida NRRL 2430]